jgi:hypothetical protein
VLSTVLPKCAQWFSQTVAVSQGRTHPAFFESLWDHKGGPDCIVGGVQTPQFPRFLASCTMGCQQRGSLHLLVGTHCMWTSISPDDSSFPFFLARPCADSGVFNSRITLSSTARPFGAVLIIAPLTIFCLQQREVPVIMTHCCLLVPLTILSSLLGFPSGDNSPRYN